jgi:hypothetical protein
MTLRFARDAVNADISEPAEPTAAPTATITYASVNASVPARARGGVPRIPLTAPTGEAVVANGAAASFELRQRCANGQRRDRAGVRRQVVSVTGARCTSPAL